MEIIIRVKRKVDRGKRTEGRQCVIPAEAGIQKTENEKLKMTDDK